MRPGARGRELPSWRTTTTRAIAAALALAVLAGCGPDAGAPTAEVELRILAAASLEPAFEELVAAFAATHPEITVAPRTYDGSSTLVTQLVEGAPGDVVATADESSMARLSDAGLLAAPAVPFATNVLRVAVAPGNPLGITSIADLAAGAPIGSRARVVVCAREVPCGAVAAAAEAAAGVTIAPASEEQNVTAVTAKVAAGEADAGLVYLTEIFDAEGTVDGVVPGGEPVGTTYPIATLASAEDGPVAAAFVAFVRGRQGRAVLAAHGFGAPPS